MNLEDLDSKTYGKLYLWAAGHFLSEWPHEWDGEKLACVLVSEEGSEHYADRLKVRLWNPMHYIEGEDAFFETDAVITCLVDSLDEAFKMIGIREP